MGMYKAGITNSWARYPEMNMDAKIELGREGDLFSTMFDMTYGAEKDTGLFKGQFEMLPMMYKAGITNTWARYPEMSVEAMIELERKGNMYSSAFDWTYGVERNNLSFNGHIDILPEMIETVAVYKASAFPETDKDIKFKVGRNGDILSARFDMSYGIEKDTAVLESTLKMLPENIEVSFLHDCSRFPETNMDAKLKLERQGDVYSTILDMT